MANRHRREDYRYCTYTVGWVCALPVELAAAQEMLDEEHAGFDHDMNTLGRSSRCPDDVHLINPVRPDGRHRRRRSNGGGRYPAWGCGCQSTRKGPWWSC